MKVRGDLEFPWINIFKTVVIKRSSMFITVKGIKGLVCPVFRPAS